MMTKSNDAGSIQYGQAGMSRRCCPNCDSSYLDRVPRHFIDRVICLFTPIKRYRCSSCGWQGTLISR